MVNLTLIHGFTQDSGVWAEVESHLPTDWAVTAIDLPGHGRNRQSRPSSQSEFLAMTRESLGEERSDALNVLCGYSMGARVALALAAAEPDRWDNLVVISSGGGIYSEDARLNRREADEGIAHKYLDEGWLEEFASYWDSLPIWSGDPEHVGRSRIRMLLNQDPAGLASALRAFGQGATTPFNGFESGVEPTVTVIRGERDAAYVEPTRHLATLTSGSPVVIPGGHSLVLENPRALADALKSIC